MARKETKRNKFGKKSKHFCSKRRKEIIIETVVVIVIIALFLSGITKIVLDEMRGKSSTRYNAELVPGSFTHIVTKSNLKTPYNI